MADEQDTDLDSGMLFAVPEEEWKSIGSTEAPSMNHYIDKIFDLKESNEATKSVLTHLTPLHHESNDRLSVTTGNLAAKELIKGLQKYFVHEQDLSEREALKSAILQTEAIIEFLIAFEEEGGKHGCITESLSESQSDDAVSLEDLEIPSEEQTQRLEEKRIEKYRAIALALEALHDVDPKALFKEKSIRKAMRLLMRVIEKLIGK